MRRLKVLIVGCGRVGVELEFDPLRAKPASHAGAVLSLKDRLELSAGMDINPEKGKSLKRLSPSSKFYTDLDEALEKVLPDIVSISAWTKEHLKIFKKVIEKDFVKGIVLEKPITPDEEGAEELISLWEKRKIPVVVNHERRWDGRYRVLKEIIDNKELGSVKTVYGKVLTGKIPEEIKEIFFKREGKGLLLHDGTHLIDLFLWFFKGFSVEKALIEGSNSFEQRTTALLITEDEKIPLFLESGGERSYFHFEVTVEFERGVVVVGNGFEKFYISDLSKRYTGFYELKEIAFPKERVKSTPHMKGAYEEVVNAIYNKNFMPFSSIVDGYKVLKKIFEIYKKGGME